MGGQGGDFKRRQIVGVEDMLREKKNGSDGKDAEGEGKSKSFEGLRRS